MRRQIDYRLARRAVLRDWRRGKLTRIDVCDAHPDLVRAARNVGEESHLDCPICEKVKLRLVSYVYGDALKAANGRCITSPVELATAPGGVRASGSGRPCDPAACAQEPSSPRRSRRLPRRRWRPLRPACACGYAHRACRGGASSG